MKILRVVYEWPPPWDGLAAGPFELTRAQALMQHALRVLCGGWPRRPVEALPGVGVRRLPSAFPFSSLFATTAPAALAWTLAWRNWADVIHGHAHLPAWYHLWRRLAKSRRPYVLHLHITAAGREARMKAHGLSVSLWTRAWEWPLQKLSDRVGCRVADAIICTSESVREEAIRFYGAGPQKLHVVSNGVNTEHFSPGGPTARQQYGFAPNDRVVLFVGVLSARKRPGLLTETLKRLPPAWKLLIVGRGPMESKLRSHAQQLGLARRVRFAGYVPYLELAPLYRAADAFVLLSKYEGYPKVILEALACGVPVVTTSSFQGDEHIEPHLTYLGEDTPDAVATAVQRAASGPPVDVASIRAVHDWRVKAKAVQQVYQKVTNG